MKYTLRQLEVFLAIATLESVSQAANKLSMSQSAVSESLKTLERQFDIQLFDRVGKSLRLNELGRSLQAEASNVLERANHLEQAFAQHSDKAVLNIGATLSIGNYLAIGMVSKFKQEHLDSTVQLKVANTTEIADRVLSYELDVGLIEGEVNHPDLQVIPWLNDELVVFCSPSHPLRKRKLLNEDDLISSSWVLRETGSGTRQAFDHAMHGVLGSLDIAMELEHTEAIKRAVEHDIGLGCLSNITLIDAFNRGSLIPLKVSHRSFKRKLYLIHHKNKYLSKGIQAWINLCNNVAKEQHNSLSDK